tara:strand:- start:690 stop:1319 length:630 start_codon:yes stop_codon:yes gene_type:complete
MFTQNKKILVLGGRDPSSDTLINRSGRREPMGKALTGTFTITASLEMTANGYGTTVIPIGSLIDVGDAQALEIEEVDYIYLNYHSTNDLYEPIHVSGPYSSDAAFGAQLMDRNAGTWLSAADNNLISSSSVYYENAGVYGVGTDFFPDDFQKTNGRFVVNDELYLVGANPTGTYAANQELSIVARIRAKVVKLGTRDWMAISLETVQNE